MVRCFLVAACFGIPCFWFAALQADDEREPGVIAAGPAEMGDAMAALDRPVTIELLEVALHEATAELGEQAGVNILLDESALDSMGSDGSEPVSFSSQNLSLRATLAGMLRPLELAAVAGPLGIVVTSIAEAEGMLTTRVYPVVDLVGRNDARRAEELVEALETCVEPGSWEEMGGAGVIGVVHGHLVVSQAQVAHRRILAVLSGLRKLHSHGNQPVIAEPDWQVRAALRKTLEQPIGGDFSNIPLIEFAEWMSNELSIPIYLDSVSLDELGLDSSEPITASFSNRRAEYVLNWVLRQIDLAWVIRDEAVWIVSRDEAATTLFGVIYPLGNSGDSPSDKVDEICHTITSIVEPDTWENYGGAGSLASLDGGRFLMIRQTQSVQGEIAALLRSLEAAQALPLAATNSVDDTAGEEAEFRVYCIPNGSAEPGALPAIKTRDLKSLVERHVDPESWKTDGRSIDTVPGRLLIQASPSVHRGVERLFEQLGLTVLKPPARAAGGQRSSSGGVF